MVTFSPKDLEQISEKGITQSKIERQLDEFKTGFPYLKLEAAASVGKGIKSIAAGDISKYIDLWNQYKMGDKKILKFVPASGAASRMFKNLFAFLSAEYDAPETDFEKAFFSNIEKFAFYNVLDKVCKEKENCSIHELMEKGCYKTVVDYLLNDKGLGYGQLPKGLLLFHKYGGTQRTPLEEHLVEGALYANCNGVVHLHYTVSPEHKELFETCVNHVKGEYESKFNVRYCVSFSVQKPSTDTIAVNPDNTPFRNSDGSLLFRPGGHGALIENLNDVDADIVFIKNIDNVVLDKFKEDTVTYKQLLAGVLVSLQTKAFEYLRLLESGQFDDDTLKEIVRFLEQELCCHKPGINDLEGAELVAYLKKKLNRPMRVCGVVKNVGEPGGGPFLAYNSDSTVSLQILESSQIDKDNSDYTKMFTEGTHFNPVDLVCATKDYNGDKFNLPDFVDRSTGFISSKSKNGKELKALELPGLWNGAMSDWNTVFVEVPLSTFNPVKTVNDLLREQHQG